MKDLILTAGAALLIGFTVPIKKGPFDIFLIIRTVLGRPFTCPLCMFFWGALLVGYPLALFFPRLATAIAASGYAILLGHWSQFHFVDQE